MADTGDPQSLLTVCIQDLFAGETMLADRWPGVARCAEDPALREALDRVTEHARRQADQLRATGRADGGPTNLWMQGILDDAERDTETIAKGPLLDAAMIGAVRKAKAAKLVSYETGVALARRLEEAALEALLERCRNEEAASDHRLVELLAARAEAAEAAD